MSLHMNIIRKKYNMSKIVEIVLIVLQNWFIIINYSDAAWDITFVENYIIRKIQKTMSRDITSYWMYK